MSEQKITVDIPDGKQDVQYVHVCDACGVEADPRAGFTLTHWDDSLEDELGLEFNYDFDENDDTTEVDLCVSCLFDGPARALRKVEQAVSDIVNYDLDKDAITAKQRRLLLYLCAALLWIPLLAYFLTPVVLIGGFLGAVSGGAAVRYLWLRSALDAYPE